MTLVSTLLVAFTTVIVIQATVNVYRVPGQQLNTCFNSSTGLTSNATGIPLSRCLSICELVTQCLSLNYHIGKQLCQFFNRTANKSEILVLCPGFIHMNVSEWKQVRSGRCSSKPCQHHQYCLPHGSSHECNTIPGFEESDTGSGTYGSSQSDGSSESDGSSQSDGSSESDESSQSDGSSESDGSSQSDGSSESDGYSESNGSSESDGSSDSDGSSQSDRYSESDESP